MINVGVNRYVPAIVVLKISAVGITNLAAVG